MLGKRFPSSSLAVSEAGAHILDIGGESTRPGVGKSSLVCSIISSSPHSLSLSGFVDFQHRKLPGAVEVSVEEEARK